MRAKTWTWTLILALLLPLDARAAGRVRLEGDSLADDNGKFNAVGFTLFPALRLQREKMKNGSAQLDTDLAAAKAAGYTHMRMFAEVGWDGGFEISPRAWGSKEYDDVFAAYLDTLARHGLRMELTLFASISGDLRENRGVPAAERPDFIRRIARLLKGREDLLLFAQVFNEPGRNGPETVRDAQGLAEQFKQAVPGALVALGGAPDKDLEAWAAAGDYIMTLHLVRFDSPWRSARDPWGTPFRPWVNDEPVGPGTHGGSTDNCEALAAQAVVTFIAGAAAFNFHWSVNQPGRPGNPSTWLASETPCFKDIPKVVSILPKGIQGRAFARINGSAGIAERPFVNLEQFLAPDEPGRGVMRVHSAEGGGGLVSQAMYIPVGVKLECSRAMKVTARKVPSLEIEAQIDCAPGKTLQLQAGTKLLLGGAFAENVPATQSGDDKNCRKADPNDDKPDDEALQACLDRGGRLELLPGKPGYILRKGLHVRRPFTIVESASAPLKAVFVAHDDLVEKMLDAEASASPYQLGNLVFDGRNRSRPKQAKCAVNLSAAGHTFFIHHLESRHAVCGSAMEVLGEDFEIADSRFESNGTPAGAGGGGGPWSDGLTVLHCTNAKIVRNYFLDNTDIDLVVGGGRNCLVADNAIEHRDAYGFAGLNVGHFGDGDHAGSVFRDNRIFSVQDKLSFGLIVGSHPWDKRVNLGDVGTVSGNRIMGAVVNLAVDGIAAGRVTGNSTSGAQGSRGFGQCRKAADYTAADFGAAELQAGFVGRAYHDGACPDVGGTAESPPGGGLDGMLSASDALARLGLAGLTPAGHSAHAARVTQSSGRRQPETGAAKLPACGDAALETEVKTAYGEAFRTEADLILLDEELRAAYDREARDLGVTESSVLCLSIGEDLAHVMNARLPELGARLGHPGWAQPGLAFTWEGLSALREAASALGQN